MAASRTRRPRWRPRAGATAAAALVLTLVLIAGASGPGAAYDVSVDPSALPRIPCDSPDDGLVDYWCGDWETNPPTLPAQPQQAFRPLGTLRFERISKEQADLLKGRPFGDVTINLDCGSRPLHYAGTYEGGQVVACTGGVEQVLEGVYREDAPGDLRSGSFHIVLPDIATPHAFTGTLHQTSSGAPANDWSGRCTGGACLSIPTTKPRCAGRAATIVGEVNPLGANLIFGTPKNDVIVGTGEDDVIAGRAGKDVICGGDGRDVITGNAGGDSLFGEAGDDVLRSSSVVGGLEFLDGGAGADHMRGGFGFDVMNPGPGKDVVDGGGGRDGVDYSHAEARVSVHLGRGYAFGKRTGLDRLIGIEGAIGTKFDDMLVGGDGSDELFGRAGDDTVRGLDGGDDLAGGEGDDLLDGGAGRDHATGGPGDNRCRSVEVRSDCDQVLP